MSMTGTAGRMRPVAKWSLVVGPVLVVVFNFLMPVNGVSPVDPGKTAAYIGKLGADADLAKVYIVLILLGVVLFTRGIIGLWAAAPEGEAKRRLGVGLLGSVAALGLWGVVLGLGLAEASVAQKVVDNPTAAQIIAGGGTAEQAGAATAAGIIANTLHAAYFGVFQVTAYVAFIALIPIGGGLAISGIVRREFGWVMVAIGVATVVLISIMPVDTEAGSLVFGIVAFAWGLVFLATGLQIMRQDMNGSTASTESSDSTE